VVWRMEWEGRVRWDGLDEVGFLLRSIMQDFEVQKYQFLLLLEWLVRRETTKVMSNMLCPN
jgi:hypothetical protein